MAADFLHCALTKRLIGVSYDVYNELGFGFLESVYESALTVAFDDAGIRFERQVPIPVWFRHQQIGDFRADLVVEGAVIIELKAAKILVATHESQVLNSLRATQIEIALLFNFGPKPEFKRLVYSNNRKRGRG